jgi:ferredoxin-NADP reductase
MGQRALARIIEIADETPSVKRFVFDCSDTPITFLPGQWLDLDVPVAGGAIARGGYSLISTPARRDRFELAIKRARQHPATRAMHERVQVGDVLQYRGGQGSFCYRSELGERLLLIAGGIGITPILSILRHMDETRPAARIHLAYAATRPEELAFRAEIDAIVGRRAGYQVHYRVSEAGPGPWSASLGHIDGPLLDRLDFGPDTQAFVCGPTAMTEAMLGLLRERGLAEAQLHRERW